MCLIGMNIYCASNSASTGLSEGIGSLLCSQILAAAFLLASKSPSAGCAIRGAAFVICAHVRAFSCVRACVCIRGCPGETTRFVRRTHKLSLSLSLSLSLTHTHTHKHTHTHTHTHTPTHPTHIHTHTHARTHTHVGIRRGGRQGVVLIGRV